MDRWRAVCSRPRRVSKFVTITDQNGVSLLTLISGASTLHIGGLTSPVLESTGPLLVSGDAQVGGNLYVQGTNVLDAIANFGQRLDASSHLVVASVSAGAIPSEPGASAFVDLQAADVLVNTLRTRHGDDLTVEASNVGDSVRIAANGIVTVQGQMIARNGLTATGGRGGSPSATS